MEVVWDGMRKRPVLMLSVMLIRLNGRKEEDEGPDGKRVNEGRRRRESLPWKDVHDVRSLSLSLSDSFCPHSFHRSSFYHSFLTQSGTSSRIHRSINQLSQHTRLSNWIQEKESEKEEKGEKRRKKDEQEERNRTNMTRATRSHRISSFDAHSSAQLFTCRSSSPLELILPLFFLLFFLSSSHSSFLSFSLSPLPLHFTFNNFQFSTQSFHARHFLTHPPTLISLSISSTVQTL